MISIFLTLRVENGITVWPTYNHHRFLRNNDMMKRWHEAIRVRRRNRRSREATLPVILRRYGAFRRIRASDEATMVTVIVCQGQLARHGVPAVSTVSTPWFEAEERMLPRRTVGTRAGPARQHSKCRETFLICLRRIQA